MTRPRRTPPRWLRRTLVAVALVVPCVVWGVTSAHVDASLGPHEARYDVTSSGLVVVDFGPLGTLQLDSPLPLGLGVLVTVEEIPAELTAVGQAQTLDGLSHDLDSYLAFFGEPQVTIASVAHDLVADVLLRTGLAIVVMGGVVAGLTFLLGAARRGEVTRALAPRTWEITAGVVVVALVVVSATASDPGSTRGPTRPASAVFAGTPLEGARITGRLGGIVDTYGALAIGLYRENEDFYAKADANLADAWDERSATQDILAAAGTRAAPDDATDDSGDAADAPAEGDAADADPTEEDAPSGTGATPGDPTSPAGPTTPPDDELVTLLMISDLHCNTGMTPLIRTAIQRSGASVVLNAGDTTMNGTGVESFCVDSFASAVPKGVQMVVADGNHDSVETAKQWTAKGAIELDGSVVDVDGVRILGDRDPLETRLGEGNRPAREETPEEYGARIADAACAEKEKAGEPVDLVMIHTPRNGNDALDSGCVPNLLAGHMHTRSGPERYGSGVRYVSGSTAGAVADQLRIGPLKGTAEMTVLRLDPEAGRIVDWQLVQVATDASAKVWPRLAWPKPVAPGEVPESEPEPTTLPSTESSTSSPGQGAGTG